MDLVPIDRLDEIKAAFIKPEPVGLSRNAVRLALVLSSCLRT